MVSGIFNLQYGKFFVFVKKLTDVYCDFYGLSRAVWSKINLILFLTTS